MQFTYEAYRGLLSLLKTQRYVFSSYHNWVHTPRCVILRHDIDNDLDQAVRLAKVEAEEGVRSSWFVLLRTDFYNPASRASLDRLQIIRSMGHEIGLHFDEKSYPADGVEETVQHILEERDILSAILGTPVTTVSMHWPSRPTLEADLEIPGMVNSYEKTFFQYFKYLSDSRRRWREPVEEIVRSGAYDRLHILTHAFWYKAQEEDIAATVRDFIHRANGERQVQMQENITDLDEILKMR